MSITTTGGRHRALSGCCGHSELVLRPGIPRRRWLSPRQRALFVLWAAVGNGALVTLLLVSGGIAI